MTLPPGRFILLEARAVDSDRRAAARPALVRRAKADGHRCIKLFFEHGFGASTAWPLPSDAVVAVRAARARQIFAGVLDQDARTTAYGSR